MFLWHMKASRVVFLATLLTAERDLLGSFTPDRTVDFFSYDGKVWNLPLPVCTNCEPTQFSPQRADAPTPATASSGFGSIHERRNLVIPFGHALPGVRCFHKNLPAGTRQQIYECAIVELDHAQLRGRILDARHAILDRAEEILTRPSCDEQRALNTAFRTLRTLEEVMAEEKSAA